MPKCPGFTPAQSQLCEFSHRQFVHVPIARICGDRQRTSIRETPYRSAEWIPRLCCLTRSLL